MPDVLTCDLASVRLSSLLQLAEAEGSSGWLLLGDWGQVGLSDGQPIAARCGPLEGYSALVTMFFIEHGEARLRVEEAPPGASLGPVVRAIMDGLRLVDEWRRIGPMVLGRMSSAPPDGTSPELRRLLEHLDGRAPVQQLLAQLDLSPARVTDALIDLIEAGLLLEVALPAAPEPWPGFRAARPPAAPEQEEVVDEESTAPAAVAPAPARDAPANGAAALQGLSFDALISHGRSLLREGDLDGSEEAFSRAVALQPDDRIAAQNLRRVQAIRRGDGGVGFRSWQRAPT